MRVVRISLVGFVALVVAPLVGCGGGGSSSSNTPAQPGVGRTLALEGATAPGGAGLFGAFPTAPPMAVADGGWSVFVAPTTGLGDVAYAASPAGALIRVFAQGDPAPDLGVGSIGPIRHVWINSTGVVLALVDVNGSVTADAGLVTARVDTGVATEVHGAIYTGTDMSSTSISGTLVSFEARAIHLGAVTGVFFEGATDVLESAFWRVNADGTGLARLVGTGDPLPGALNVASVYAADVDASGTVFAFIAERTDIGATLGIYTGTVGSFTFGEVAAEGDDLLPPDVLASLPAFQPLLVYPGSSTTTVLYEAVSDGGDDYLLYGIPGQPDYRVARQGDLESLANETLGSLAWLRNQRGAAHPLFQASLLGAPASFAVFSLEAIDFSTTAVTLGLPVFDGRPAPGGDSQSFGPIFPGLNVEGLVDASAGGNLAFSNLLQPSGETGLFWELRGVGIYTTARAGYTIPGGGDTFANDPAWRSTTASGVILYRAPVSGAGSGIFRRGP